MYLFRSHLLEYWGTVADQNRHTTTTRKPIDCIDPLLYNRSAAFVPTIEYGQTDTEARRVLSHCSCSLNEFTIDLIALFPPS